MKLSIVFLFAAVFALAACEDPSASSPKATTADPTAVTSSGGTPAARGEALKLTPENSKVGFTGSKVTGKHDGGFNDFTGSIDLVNEDPQASSVRVEIDMNSVWTDNPTVTEHLKTADFFEVEKHPTAVFSSTAIKPSAAGGNAFEVTGDLELHGVRRAVTFPATIEVNGDAVKVNAEFSINRREFGIDYAGPTNDLIRDGVVIRLDLNAPRSK